MFHLIVRESGFFDASILAVRFVTYHIRYSTHVFGNVTFVESMLGGMGRNEEEDRYTAALAITQLSEVLLVQDDGSNASANSEIKSKVENVEDGLDYKPSVSIESLTLNESPPLDLTLKKKPIVKGSDNVTGNFFCSEKSVPNSCAGFTLNVTKGKHGFDWRDDAGRGHDFSSNIIPSTSSSRTLTGRSMLRCEPFGIPSELNTIFIQKPVLGVVSVKTNNSFLSQNATVPENLKLPINEYGARIRGLASNVRSYSEMEEASPSSNDGFVKFRPRGLSSISNYYRNIGVEKSKRAKKQVHTDQKHILKSGHVVCTEMPQPNFTEFRVQNKIPSGLSSIKEYYHKGQFHQRLKHKPLDPTEHSPRLPSKRSFPVVPLPVDEVSSAELYSSAKNIHRPLKLHKRKMIKIRPPAVSPIFSSFLDNQTPEPDFLGKPLKRRIHWSSDTSQDIQDNTEIKIPLKVLELSLTDDSAILESKCTTLPSSLDDPREKGFKSCKHRLDKKGKPLEVKRETEEQGMEAKVTYDFLNPDEDGDYIIHIAASQGDVEQMKYFLKLMRDQGGDINCRDAFRQTPLHIAVEMDNLGMLSCLLKAGANPCLPGCRGQTCLHLAILYNNIQALDLMLQYSKGSKFNCNAMNYEGLTALHLAVLKDQIESTNLLICSGLVDVDAKEGKSGKTALYLSAEHNRTAILSTLLARGASDKETDYSGYTPYQAAMTKQNREIISIFDEQKKDKLQT